MSRLRFIIGSIADFQDLGIDTSGCRQSLDGTQTMIHQELVEDTDFNNIIDSKMDGKSFSFMSNDSEQFNALMNGEDWSGE